MAELTAHEMQNVLAIAFVKAFARSISETGGAAWKIGDSLPTRPEQSILDSVIVKLTLEGNLKGDVLMEFSREEVETLNSCANSKAEEADAGHDEPVVQLLAKQKERICLELQHTYGAFRIEPSLFVKQPLAAEPNASDGIAVSFTDDAGNMLHINVYILGDLASSLVSRSMPVETTEGSAPNESEQINLDLVLEVELNVTVRFGQRQLTLREVLELTSGSVIELDRQVDEPVELLLDGKVIARGEAVVVDGNYGLRITEVPQLISPAFLV